MSFLFFLGEIRTMLNSGLIISYGKGKSFYVLNPRSHESWDFASDWRDRHVLSPEWALVALILSGGPWSGEVSAHTCSVQY